MLRLKTFLIAASLSWTHPASASPTNRWAPYIAEASTRFGVPKEWIRRVLLAESGGRTFLHGRPIVSRAGAMGLMQLMPGTWREMRSLLGLGEDPHDPRDNILAGTAYLRAMYDRFGYPGLFAAYNAGPARYARHLRGRRPLPAETVAYVTALAGRVAPPVPREATSGHTLFALESRRPEPAPGPEMRGERAGESLFVPLSRPPLR